MTQVYRRVLTGDFSSTDTNGLERGGGERNFTEARSGGKTKPDGKSEKVKEKGLLFVKSK